MVAETTRFLESLRIANKASHTHIPHPRSGEEILPDHEDSEILGTLEVKVLAINNGGECEGFEGS